MIDLVVGAGAVGTLIAASLASGGREVAIVRRRLDGPPRPGRVAVVDRDGVRREAVVTQVRRLADLPAPPELIVLAVKMYDLADALASCTAWPTSPVLTVSNGIGAEETAAERRQGGLIAASVVASVELAEEGVVVRRNRGGIALATVRGDVEPLIAALVVAFRRAGVQATRCDDVAAMKWSKLVANLVANATSAILDLPPAEIYGDPDLFGIERRQLLEAFAVMRLNGLEPVKLPGVDVRLLRLGLRLPAPLVRPILRRVVAGARGRKDPSLRLHAGAGGGPSEVDWLNGAVAREAQRHGRAAPVNRRLAELVTEVLADPERHAWFRGRPDRLVAELARPG
jgi:2-dehydropantoate 2-reductase